MQRTKVNGLDMAFEMAGQRLPLLLVHAFPLDHEMWTPQIRTFSADRRVVAPDLIGFGSSDSDGRLSIDQHADDLAELLNALGIESAIVCGLSMGGYVALALCRRHPERVSALILADTRAGADTPENADQRRATADLVRREGMPALAATLPEKLLSPMADSLLIAQVRTIMLRQPPEGVSSALEAMAERPDSTSDLAAIGVPALVLVGSNDSVTPLAESELLSRELPDAKLVRIPGAGHLANVEEPGAFNAAVRAFLRLVDHEQGSESML